jgi:hypothetical protein
LRALCEAQRSQNSKFKIQNSKFKIQNSKFKIHYSGLLEATVLDRTLRGLMVQAA